MAADLLCGPDGGDANHHSEESDMSDAEDELEMLDLRELGAGCGTHRSHREQAHARTILRGGRC